MDSWYPHRGHRVYVREEGAAGPDLLCLHGFPTSGRDWRAIMPALRTRFRVLAPDMLGFGRSAKPRHYPYSILDQADLHENLLRAKGIRRAHLLAHDYGDSVAQELLVRARARAAAGDHSLRLASVCLLNGGLFPEAHHPLIQQRLLAGPLGPALSALTTETLFTRALSSVFIDPPEPAELRRDWLLWCARHGHRNTHRLLGYLAERRRYRARWVGVLENSAVPLRFVCGLADPVSGSDMADRYRLLVSDPDLVAFPDVGHYPQLEAPGRTLAAFLDFHDTRVDP
ncbi:alpha/beta hydrolase [Nocardia panacis]|uniref:Alpha/beta hydrolase n=1 Tax=Nocardia panacis TaxID=2340916 RepID=A0A3A4KDB5_9NOCA|nr:alpha/beta hydrolase [Nocardia panacis]RJO78433.1 alpha/beta hydrolase [Nocardia panacis]